jgi:hypothetical protein
LVQVIENSRNEETQQVAKGALLASLGEHNVYTQVAAARTPRVRGEN